MSEYARALRLELARLDLAATLREFPDVADSAQLILRLAVGRRSFRDAALEIRRWRSM